MVVRQADEEWLVERARRGDLEAFNALVERYEGVIYNLCLRMLGSREQAQDATQETFLSAFRSINRLQGNNINAWLLRIAANASYDELRKRGRRPSGSLDAMLDDEDHPFTPSDGDPTPEEQTLRSEVRHDIEQALLLLPAPQRLAVLLCDVDGLRYDEIAEVTHTSLGTVKSRVSRGRARLRELLGRNGEPLPESLR